MSLYDRLGGVYPIAAVVDRFSDALLTDLVVGTKSENPALVEWDTVDYETRLPGLKFMRTLWVCALAGGPFEYTGKSLREAHFRFAIKPEQFDAVANALAESLDYYNVPQKERDELLDVFIAQKNDVTAGSRHMPKVANTATRCPFASLE